MRKSDSAAQRRSEPQDTSIQFGYRFLLGLVVLTSIMAYSLVALKLMLLFGFAIVSYILLLLCAVLVGRKRKIGGVVWIAIAVTAWILLCFCIDGYKEFMFHKLEYPEARYCWPFNACAEGELTWAGAVFLLECLKHITLCVLLASALFQLHAGNRTNEAGSSAACRED